MNKEADDMGKQASVGQRIGGGLVDLFVSFVLVLMFASTTGLGETLNPDAAVSIIR